MSQMSRTAGILAGVVFFVLGFVSIGIGISGHNEVTATLNHEFMTGAADMTPSAIAAEAKAAKMPPVPAMPTCSVAGKKIKTGSDAQCFEQYMRIQALELTGGRPSAQVPQFLTTSGKETNDPNQAAKDPTTKQPVTNPAMSVWVTENSLSTPLDLGYLIQQLSMFALVLGAGFILLGICTLLISVRKIRSAAPAGG
jgi:hypothetical protein